MTTITEKECKTVEEEMEIKLCNACLTREDKLSEKEKIFEIDNDNHICTGCIANAEGNVVKYNSIKAKQSNDSVELNISVDDESLCQTLKSDEPVRGAANFALSIVLWPFLGAFTATEVMLSTDGTPKEMIGYGHSYIAALIWIFISLYLYSALVG